MVVGETLLPFIYLFFWGQSRFIFIFLFSEFILNFNYQNKIRICWATLLERRKQVPMQTQRKSISMVLNKNQNCEV